MRFSAEDVAAAVAAANADRDTAIATARTEAVKAERDRIAAVIALPAAAGKAKQAMALAMSGADVAQATALLALTPPDAAADPFAGRRSKDAPGGLVVDAVGESFYGASETATGWHKAVARANNRVEAAMAAETNR